MFIYKPDFGFELHAAVYSGASPLHIRRAALAEAKGDGTTIISGRASPGSTSRDDYSPKQLPGSQSGHRLFKQELYVQLLLYGRCGNGGGGGGGAADQSEKAFELVKIGGY